MDIIDFNILADAFGEESVRAFKENTDLLQMKEVKLDELIDLRDKASQAFDIHLTLADILVCASAGVLMGTASALFKTWVVSHDELKNSVLGDNPIRRIEKHAPRTGIDYHTPKVGEFKNDLHRQLGPSHDVFRFKETLEILKGNKTDFELWDTTIGKILGSGNPRAAILRAKGMKLEKFLELGGFKLPLDPKAELINHLLADFFTKTSLPIPGSTYVSDHSKELAKLMFGMYDRGFNLKSLIGNSLGFIILQLIIYSYTFIFKVSYNSGFDFNNVTIDSISGLLKKGWAYRSTNEFHAMMMLGHGSSFLVDTLITTGSQNYMGLFQLNFASLMWFSKHLVQYVVKCSKEYRELMHQVKDKAKEISYIDEQWYNSYKKRFLAVATDEKFIEFIDPYCIKQNHDDLIDIIDGRRKMQIEMKEAIEEMQGKENG